MNFTYMPNGTTVIMLEIARFGDYDPEHPANTPESKWVQVPQPAAMQYVSEDYDSDKAGRTLNLRMIRDRLGTKIKLELEWNYITLAEISTLLQIVDAESFWVRFIDPKTGTRKVFEMYAGNKTAPYYNVLKNSKGEPVVGFESLSMNFIEM